VPGRDWDAEIDVWTERFRHIADPPEVFARAIRDGWDPGERRALAEGAAAYARRHDGYLAQLRESGWDLVRMDTRDACGACARYSGSPYSLTGGTPGVPPPPPLPICPACRHTLNMLTPYFMQSSGLDAGDLVRDAVPYEPVD
jgi:hypothetical protein